MLPTRENRLRPCLLQLLRDNPGGKKDALSDPVVNRSQLRDSVREDLKHLLKATNLEHGTALAGLSPEDRQLVLESVVNYGIPEFTRLTVSADTCRAVEAMIRDAVLRFEPRILPESLRVRAVEIPGAADRNPIAFEVVGELWCEPVPLHLLLRTVVDLNTGKVAVQDSAVGAD